jgi:outer membrane lipoprotein SlyB
MGHRKVIFIGGGAAGGALLGAAIGGGKGALIGGLLGAGGGFLGDRLTKGPNAEVKSGTEFGVWLNQGISMPKFAETGYTNP